MECFHENCNHPVVNINGRLSIFCDNHHSNVCMVEECNADATFRYLDDNLPTHCEIHRDYGMISE